MDILSTCVWTFGSAFTATLVLCVTRALMCKPPRQTKVRMEDDELISTLKDGVYAAKDAIIKRFAKSLTFKTISTDVHEYDRIELKRLADYIRSAFPNVHSSEFITVETVNEYSLLFTVEGSNTDLKPYLLAAHLDVVPVEASDWDFPAFEGLIEGGFVYGRGAVDIKSLVMSILEALELLIAHGFRPKRSFYVAFGHDEEVTGLDGAAYIKNNLDQKGIKELEFVLDEGLCIVKNAMPGISRSAALIGVTEKGYVNIKLSVKGHGGHSSMPPTDTAITILSKAVSKFHSNIQPPVLGRVEKDMIRTIAPYASFPMRIIYCNIWLFSPILLKFLSLKPTTNALVRTTTAVTIISGGVKDNVVPSSATALVNHRTHPTQNMQGVFEIDKKLVNDKRVDVSIEQRSYESHPVSAYDDDSLCYRALGNAFSALFPDAILTPGTLVGGTDTKWYLPLTRNVYRCIPVELTLEETKMIHGYECKREGNFRFRKVMKTRKSLEAFSTLSVN